MPPVSSTSPEPPAGPLPDPFPELDVERQRLRYSRACRDAMIVRFGEVDPDASADHITKEYVEVTVAEALDDLRTPGAGDFFGRITEASGAGPWYVGRRHIEDEAHDPVVVDWRAAIAAPFYRATGVDALGLAHRRRFTLVDGDLTAYLDEQLDDPEASGASGVPDPVLAEIGVERSGAMREIVATIQAEQDVVIRAPVDQCLVVQGGPGTGKTAVGLHRAAYLLFEHRRRLVRDGVLVVGPNRVFLDYIGNVLPSLGERSVQQKTVTELCIPRLAELLGSDTDEARARKGSPAMLEALEAASTRHVTAPVERVRQPLGARTLVFEPDEMSEWIARALDGSLPVNRRRESLRPIIERELLQRTGTDVAYARLGVLRAALNKAWPAVQPMKLVDRVLLAEGFGPGGRRRRWTMADQLLVDEANTMLNGTPFTFGHVVVDEAQDHSAVALRVIGRRSPSGSMTVLGDLAQSTTPAGQRTWESALAHLLPRTQPARAGRAGSVAHLTIGYRVPGPILDVANRLLPFTGVDTAASTSVRRDGAPPTVVQVSTERLAAAVAAEVRIVRHRHRNTGIVAPEAWFGRIDAALADEGLRACGRVQQLDGDEVPMFTPETVKGLEFDGVVVVNPAEIVGGSERGARLLYVALTRAVQTVHLVSNGPLPGELAAPVGRM